MFIKVVISAAAPTAIGPSSANRLTGTRSTKPQMPNTRERPAVAAAQHGAETPNSRPSSSPAHSA